MEEILMHMLQNVGNQLVSSGVQSAFGRSDFRYTHGMTNIPAQVNEMRKAGLNPALAYGQISSPQGQSLGQYQSDYASNTAAREQAKLMKEQVGTQRAQTDYYNALAFKTRMEGVNREFLNSHQEEDYGIQSEFLKLRNQQYQLGNTFQTLKNNWQRIENGIHQIEWDAKPRQIEADLQKVIAEAVLFGSQSNRINRLLPYEVSKLIHDTSEVIVRTTMEYNLGEYYSSQKDLSASEKLMYDLANDWERYLTDDGNDMHGKSVYELRNVLVNALSNLIPSFGFYKPLTGRSKTNKIGFNK